MDRLCVQAELSDMLYWDVNFGSDSACKEYISGDEVQKMRIIQW